MSDPDERSRGQDGNCVWHKADPYLSERGMLDNERNPADPDDPTPWDVAALEFIDEVMAAAESDEGFDPTTYSAPMGRRRRVRQSNMPWIGEIKTHGVNRRSEGGRRLYRVYFAEPDLAQSLLAALLAYKTTKQANERVLNTSTPKSSLRQSAQVTTVAGIVRRWCKERALDYRRLK